VLKGEAAQRMADHDRFAVEFFGSGAYVIDVVGHREFRQRLVGATAAVGSETHRGGAEAVTREVVEEVFVPAPRGVTSAVDEQQRRRVRIRDMTLVDDFQHQRAPRSPHVFRTQYHRRY
jgi:hypothetical protein